MSQDSDQRLRDLEQQIEEQEKLTRRPRTTVMEEERRRLLQEALQRLSQRMPQRRYHPERHYMRGPGPKTLSKIGEMLRAETKGFAREPIPLKKTKVRD